MLSESKRRVGAAHAAVILFCLTFSMPVLGESPHIEAADYLREGRSLVANQKFWEAIEVFTKALNASPNGDLMFQIYVERAKTFLEVGTTGWAYHDLKGAERIQPEDPTISFLMGKGFLIERGYLPAVNEFGKALQSDPYNPEYLTERIKAYLGLERFQDVLKDIQKLEVLLPLTEEIHTYAAQAYVGLGNDQRALEELDQAIQLNKRFFEARRMRAQLLNKLGRKRDATRDLLFAVRQNTFLKALSSRKERLKTQVPLNYKEELEKTLRDLDLLLELRPNFHRSYLMKARVLLALKLPTEALDVLENISQSKALSAGAYLLKGKAYRALMQDKAALASLEEASKRDPHDPEIYIEKCLLLLSEGDVESTSLLIEKIKNVDPENPFLLEIEGISLLMRGEGEMASGLFERFNRLVQSPFEKTGFSTFHWAKYAYSRHRNFQRFLREATGYPARFLYLLSPSGPMVGKIFDKIDFVKRFQEFRTIGNSYTQKFEGKKVEYSEAFDANLMEPFLTDKDVRSRLKKVLEKQHDPGTSRDVDVLLEMLEKGKFGEFTAAEKELFLRAFVLNAPIWKYKGEYMNLISLFQQIHFGERWSTRGKTRKTVGFYVVPSKKLYAKEKRDWIIETGAYYSGYGESVYIKDEAIPTLRYALFVALHELAHWMTVDKGLLYRSEDMHMVREGLANELAFSLLKLLDQIYPVRGYDYLVAEGRLRYYWYQGSFPYTMGQVFSEIVHEETDSSWPAVLGEIIRNPKTFFEKIGMEKSYE